MPIQVHIHELVPAFYNGGKARFFLDRETGQVLMDFDGAMYDERGEDIRGELEHHPGRFIEIESIGSRETLRMMRTFLEECTHEPVRHELEKALQTDRPFQNFRNTVADYPECNKEWIEFETKTVEELARAWLQEHRVEADLFVPDPEELLKAQEDASD